MQTNTLTEDPNRFQEHHSGASVDDDRRCFDIAVRMLDFWGFNDQEKAKVLGDISVSTFRRYKRGEMKRRLTADCRTRISLILGIYKALRIIFVQDMHHAKWVNNPNKRLNELSPKAVMVMGSMINLYDIRRYLDAVRN
ncbi:Protein of unknown function [Pseudidiomarina planktonica]|uniref:Antitoxin Xre/MbcA/ParS-like toxin-binding domain-containing protein n=1 Tax=Pseudidiomarina planktonica TaxID=1323738 RepID=A0A1Y6E9Q5_9GAMM|nr:antitoxin Xre-like helix-turn-helix domain-containing protein [Pseudidiomarina planktonica]SMQ59318.1 Protein of unknown function [Pseudidiomarina planktonica]